MEYKDQEVNGASLDHQGQKVRWASLDHKDRKGRKELDQLEAATAIK